MNLTSTYQVVSKCKKCAMPIFAKIDKKGEPKTKKSCDCPPDSYNFWNWPTTPIYPTEITYTINEATPNWTELPVFKPGEVTYF